MKLLVIENSLLALETIRKDLIESLGKKYEVKVYSLRAGNYKYSFQAKAKIRVKILTLYNSLNFLFDCLTSRKLITFTIRPLILGFFISLFLPYINFCPTITGTGPLTDSKKIIYKILRFLYPIFLFKSHCIFTHNKTDAEYLLQRIPHKKIIIIGGSGIKINNDFFNRRIYSIPNNPPRIACFSRLLKDKGIINYMEGTEMIFKKYEFMKGNIFLAGLFWDANLKSNIVSKISIKEWEEKGGKFINQPQNKEAFYLSMDIICLPSFREGLSNILLEAGYLGCILTASSVPGCIDIIEDNCGISFAPRSSKDVFKALDKAIHLSKKNQIIFRKNVSSKIKIRFSKNKVISDYHANI